MIHICTTGLSEAIQLELALKKEYPKIEVESRVSQEGFCRLEMAEDLAEIRDFIKGWRCARNRYS